MAEVALARERGGERGLFKGEEEAFVIYLQSTEYDFPGK